jgi:hypothetical protein
MSYRRQRINRLEAMMQAVIRPPQCATIGYAYTADDISRGLTLDEKINSAVQEQASYSRTVVALPDKMERADWIVMAQMNQGELNV